MTGVQARTRSSRRAPAAARSGEDGPTVITRKRLLLASALILIALIGLYFLIPKLAGLKQTWSTLR